MLAGGVGFVDREGERRSGKRKESRTASSTDWGWSEVGQKKHRSGPPRKVATALSRGSGSGGAMPRVIKALVAGCLSNVWALQ